MTLLQANSLLPPARSMTPPQYSGMPGCKQAADAQGCYKDVIGFHVSFATYFLSRSQRRRPVLERTWAVK